MIINRSSVVRTRDLARYGWTGLRRFQNIGYVTERICDLHQLEPSQHRNARKQAEQLRYCLIQANEYADAAAAVTLATKPNLLYYSIMSLALAEILFKQSGLSSLDRAREEHRHHGLELRIHTLSKKTDALSYTAAGLIAAPLIRSTGERFGTFELWHRSSREFPLIGEYTERHSGGREITSNRIILWPSDIELAPIPEHGLTLLECFQWIPGMRETLHSLGVRPEIIRAQIKSMMDVSNSFQTYRLVIHPGYQEAIQKFYDHILINPNDIDQVQFQEFPVEGGILSWNDNPISGSVRFRIPHGIMSHANEIVFWPTDLPLNEFGLLYVALFIAGNYARYFPDRWLADVERSSPLALAIEQLLAIAEEKMSLYTLSELSRSYHVPEE